MELQKSALEQLTQAYTKGKADMMEWRTMMQAMPGQLSQVAKAFGVSTDDLYEKLKKGKISMDDFMAKIVELNENGVEGFQSFSEQAKNSTDSIATAITNLGNRIKKGFATILESIDKALGQTSLGSVAGLINTISGNIRDAMSKIGTAIENSQGFKDFIEKIANAISILNDRINSLDTEQLTKMVDIFIKLIEWAPKLFLIGEGFTILGKTMKTIGGALGTISKLVQLIGMIPTPALIIVGIITAITGAIIYLYNTNEEFRNAVQNSLQIVQTMLQNMWEFLQPLFDVLKEQLTILWNKLQPLFDFLKQAIPPLIVILGAVISAMLAVVTTAITIGTMIINKVVDVVSAVITRIVETQQKIVDVVTHLDYYIGYFIGLIIGKVVKCVTDIWNFITVKIPETITAIINYIKELPGKIWEWLKKTIEKVINFGKDMKTEGEKGAEDTSKSIIDKLKELPGKVWEIGSEVVKGIWEGMKNMAGWIQDRVGEFAKGILDGMKASLGVHSPSTLFRDEIGKNIALGIGVGFENTIAKVYGEMESAISNETAKLGKEMTATGNVSIERNANVTSLLNGLIEQENTFTSNVMLDSKVIASAVNKVNKRNAFASGIA